jgi:tetratricopeptide (TPR) repeat protein
MHPFRKSSIKPYAKAAGLLLVHALAMPATATPYTPANSAQVVERLPMRNDPQQREFKRLRDALAASPGNLQLATELAKRYIEASRRESDPRYLGYAQVALSSWWNVPHPPAEVRVLRATILQSTHQFPQALAELNKVLETDRGNAQAWLTRATILQVLGEYEQAKTSCAKLYPLAPQLVTIACLASVASLSGQADKGYDLLNTALRRNGDAESNLKVWALTLLAEIAARQDWHARAEAHFREALSLAPGDSYLLAAYADFLLDRNRAADVAALLKNSNRGDALLLRHAIAMKQLGSPDAIALIETLRARFSAAMLRGDTLHQREQARFELELTGDSKTALALARRNWEVQREPADARVLFEAALANNDKAAARPALAWMKQSGVQDRALARLAGKLGG